MIFKNKENEFKRFRKNKKLVKKALNALKY